MDTRVWTAEDIRQQRCIEAAAYQLFSIWIFVLAVPLILIHTLVWHYGRHLNRSYLFVVPSVYTVCILAAYLVPRVLSHIGMYIPIFGIRIGIPPVLPPTCEAMSSAGIRNTFPCQVETVLNWVHLAGGGGSLEEIWTWRAIIYTSLAGSIVLLLMVLGLWCTTATCWKHRCGGCGKEQGRAQFEDESRRFRGSLWCRTCRGLDEVPPFRPARRSYDGGTPSESEDTKL
ncbi:hypothetical protein LTS12_026145 [Elasticomyces elasticus]|nr:hypothetical protein LTS12_026145 [Elasticomyces elasticus]